MVVVVVAMVAESRGGLITLQARFSPGPIFNLVAAPSATEVDRGRGTGGTCFETCLSDMKMTRDSIGRRHFYTANYQHHTEKEGHNDS